MNELVVKHKDIQTKILEFIDNESNSEDDTTAFLNYLTKMDLNIYEVNIILHFLSIISCNHHRNIYFFIKIKQIIGFYMSIIKENFSSSLISQIFRKSKPLMLHFYKEKILNIEDLVKQSQENCISDFFYPEIKSNIHELIKNQKMFNIIIDNINFYLKNIYNDMNDYPLLKSFLYGRINQDSDSFIFDKIKSFLEKAIDDKIEELYFFFISHSSLDKVKLKERKKGFLIFYNLYELPTNNILETFYSRLLVFNGNLNNNKKSINDYSYFHNKRMFRHYTHSYNESMIKKCMKNEKYIYKIFFNYIKKTISKEGNKYINLFIEIKNFFIKLGPLLEIIFFKKFFKDQDEKQNDSNENDGDQDDSYEEDENNNNLIEEDETNNDLNEEDEEECYEDNPLYQTMYPKIKEFLDDVISQMNITKSIRYHQISSKVISFCDEIINYELEYEFNELFKPCFNQNFIQDETFEENRQKGENESYMCQLIRDDSIEEFIIYTNKMNYSLTRSTIPSSIFETNSFLINKKTSLIEYAAFFGSIQIFQYLLLNDVELRPELWLYAIHGRNAEIIHMLEENHIHPKEETYLECFYNSVKCYHNEIATYILDNLYDKKNSNNLNDNHFPLILYGIDMNIRFNTNNKYIDLKIIKTFNIEFFSFVNLTQFKYDSSLFKNNSQVSYFEYLFWTNNEDNKSLILKIASREKQLSSVIDYILPTLTEIKPATFINSLIQKISIPNSIKRIDREAFYESEKLTEVIIPSSVVEIRNKAFYGCYSLQKVILSPSIKIIGDFVFSQCSSLEKIVIPSSVTHIGDYAFNQCKSLWFVSIPSSVISIGKYAFRECKSLEKITIPSSQTKIGGHAFNLSSLKYALIVSSNKSIENNNNVFRPQTYVIQIVLN